MVIFDECHHVASADTEAIARTTTATYVYGLTGTIKRDDGMQPITIMQCGPIRYTVDVKDQMAAQRFTRRFIPRFTTDNLDLIEPFTYHDYLQAACDSKPRNDMILDDTMTVIQAGRTPLVLTKRIEHARALSDGLQRRGCRHVILLYGADQKTIRQEKLQQVTQIPPSESLAVVATGSYIGEGFDQKRFDTLMLAAPVSVETAVTQYIGRLHRDNDGKREVRIYDYIDVTVPMSSTMYRKRLKTYLSQGYEPLLADKLSNNMLRQAKTAASLNRTHALTSADSIQSDAKNAIVTAVDFLTVFRNDIMRCNRSITINANYLSQRGINQFDEAIMQAVNRGVTITITVRQSNTATETSRARTQRNVTRLQALGCQVHTVESCNVFAIFDDILIWFGTIEPLGNTKPDDCSLRFHDPTLARQLIQTLNDTDE